MADISEAKQELWRCYGGDVIGSDMPRRRESAARPLEEANTQDIKTALCKLDKARQLPNIMVDAFSLDKIPRWHPEEQNQICLADRMLRLENRVTRLQETMDNNMAENMVLKEKMDCMKERDNTYADMVKGQSLTLTLTLQTLALRGMLMTSQQLCGEDMATSGDVLLPVMCEVMVEVDVAEITLVNVAEV